MDCVSSSKEVGIRFEATGASGRALTVKTKVSEDVKAPSVTTNDIVVTPN